MAAFVLYRALRPGDLTRADRLVLVALALGAAPLFVLVSTTGSVFQNWPRGANAPGRPLLVGLTTAWILLALGARRRLHRDVPAGWPQLRRAAWLALGAGLPPLSTLLALGQLVPDLETGALGEGAWPFLIAAALLAPVLFHRALRSPRATDVDRVVALLACLGTIALAVFTALAWHFVRGWPEGTPLRWGVAGSFVAAWIALAAATRGKLRR
jgi:hypothetical protein